MGDIINKVAPPIGCAPAWHTADSRITELSEAIIRQVNKPDYIPNYQAIKLWAEEIAMQADIVEHYRRATDEKS